MKTKEQILDKQHWDFENYAQRITTKDWKTLLMNDDDKIIYRGRVLDLVAKKIFSGVVEITKEKLGDK